VSNPGTLLNRGQSMRLTLFALLSTALGLTSGSAFAYWELVPQLGAGITWESNPRYLSDSERNDVSGTFTLVGLDGNYKIPANEVNLRTVFQQTNYLDSDGTGNESLNANNWSVDMGATHEAQRGNVGVSAGYAESPIRSGDVDPNAPPESGGGGSFAEGTVKTGSLGTSLTYNLSPRNVASLSGGVIDNTYDVSGDRPFNAGYFDYTNSQVSVAMSHYLNEKNFFQIALNGGTFTSTAQNGPAENTTDSFGINAAYSYAVTETLTGTVTAGVSRSSVDIRGLPFDPLTGAICPQEEPCSASDEARNFVGNVRISKRSEETIIDFDASRALTPQSNGTQDVQDSFSLYVLRTLTSRLSASAGTLFSNSSAVGGLGRQNQKYFTINTSLSYQLTPTLSTYGKYTYVSEDNGTSGTDTNNLLFFGVTYRGVGFRR